MKYRRAIPKIHARGGLSPVCTCIPPVSHHMSLVSRVSLSLYRDLYLDLAILKHKSATVSPAARCIPLSLYPACIQLYQGMYLAVSSCIF